MNRITLIAAIASATIFGSSMGQAADTVTKVEPKPPIVLTSTDKNYNNKETYVVNGLQCKTTINETSKEHVMTCS